MSETMERFDAHVDSLPLTTIEVSVVWGPDVSERITGYGPSVREAIEYLTRVMCFEEEPGDRD